MVDCTSGKGIVIPASDLTSCDIPQPIFRKRQDTSRLRETQGEKVTQLSVLKSQVRPGSGFIPRPSLTNFTLYQLWYPGRVPGYVSGKRSTVMASTVSRRQSNAMAGYASGKQDTIINGYVSGKQGTVLVGYG